MCGVPFLWLALCSSACVSPGGCPSFSQVGPAHSHWVPLLWPWCAWGASTVYFSYVFLRDVVTLWVNSVFLSLLIANEGLQYWLFLSDFAYHFWGRVVVYLRPRSVCRHFWWLVAALWPGLLMSFASGLSSPGLICCLGMLSGCPCGCAPVGPGVSWPSCLSFALPLALVLQVPVGSLLPYGSQPSRWGHPCGVEASLSSIGTKV